MKGSFQIIKAFDIPVRIHWSFVLIFGGFLYYGFYQGWNAESIIWASLFILALFTCVVLHEFGHALTAKYYGVTTRDIILLPIGGLARLDRLPEKPFQEFLVAAAGPAVNIVIVLLLYPYVLFVMNGSLDLILGVFSPYSNFTLDQITPFGSFIIGLIAMNGILALFNLIPAFPMDGGRILRALLSIRLSRLKATRIAAYIGQFIAVFLFLFGLLPAGTFSTFIQPSIFISLIGVFVFVMAGNEYKMIRMEAMLQQFHVAAITRRQFTKLYSNDTIENAAQRLESGLERSFLVFDDWQNLQGVLSESKILSALKKGKEAEAIEGHLSRNYESLLLDDDLYTVYSNMQKEGYSLLPVYEFDKIIGVVDQSMIQRFLHRREKLKNK